MAVFSPALASAEPAIDEIVVTSESEPPTDVVKTTDENADKDSQEQTAPQQTEPSVATPPSAEPSDSSTDESGDEVVEGEPSKEPTGDVDAEPSKGGSVADKPEEAESGDVPDKLPPEEVVEDGSPLIPVAPSPSVPVSDFDETQLPDPSTTLQPVASGNTGANQPSITNPNKEGGDLRVIYRVYQLDPKTGNVALDEDGQPLYVEGFREGVLTPGGTFVFPGCSVGYYYAISPEGEDSEGGLVGQGEFRPNGTCADPGSGEEPGGEAPGGGTPGEGTDPVAPSAEGGGTTVIIVEGNVSIEVTVDVTNNTFVYDGSVYVCVFDDQGSPEIVGWTDESGEYFTGSPDGIAIQTGQNPVLASSERPTGAIVAGSVVFAAAAAAGATFYVRRRRSPSPSSSDVV
ncbi:MAG: hypothetical protein EOP91_15705 [Lysobacteraceae bacterium]|nr:MAG: hypothetical protein EOP91_15705 [Xanthomonadaceae bacterium]